MRLAVSMATVQGIQLLASVMSNVMIEVIAVVILNKFAFRVSTLIKIVQLQLHLFALFYTVHTQTAKPVIPTDVYAINITSTSAVIVWTVPSIIYTTEQYTVVYGLNPAFLDLMSSPVYSSPDLTLLNQTYSLTLNDLQPVSTYYYRIRSENTEDASTTETLQFTTVEDGE